MPQTPHDTYEGGVMRRTAKNWKSIRDDEKRSPRSSYERKHPLRSDSMIPEAAARVGYPEGNDRAAGGGRFKKRGGRGRSR